MVLDSRHIIICRGFYSGDKTSGGLPIAKKKKGCLDMVRGIQNFATAHQLLNSQWFSGEDERLSLLGDSFSIFSFVIPAAALCKRFLGPINYQHLAKRMGMAPGISLDIKSVCPIQRGMGYGAFSLSVSKKSKR